MLEMFADAEYKKDIVTKKRTKEFETVEVSHSYSSIMSSQDIVKKEDLDTFTIPCTIKVYVFGKAWCDSGQTSV